MEYFVKVLYDMPYETITILGSCIGLLLGFIWFTLRPMIVEMCVSINYKMRRYFIKKSTCYTLYRGVIDFSDIKKSHH